LNANSVSNTGSNIPRTMSSAIPSGSRRNAGDWVPLHARVATDQGEIVGYGLCDQHAVERITMKGREIAQCPDVPEMERELGETTPTKLFLEVGWRPELSEGPLDLHLPCRDGAHEHDVVWILELAARVRA
jgi:hypothetical protein